MKKITLLLLLHSLAAISVGQASRQHLKGSNRITLGLGHTSISKGQVQGKTQWLDTASWTLNYDYRLTDKWAIGLQNDIILESFIIEDHYKEIIEMSYPVSVIPVAIYKPGKHLSLIGGVGAEFASGHTLTLTRLCFEYGFHLPKTGKLELPWFGQ
jgi:hypothetical protein